MNKCIAKPVKDFSDIMATVDFKNVGKKVQDVSEMTLPQIQKWIDFYNNEISFIYGEMQKTTSDKEKSFLSHKLTSAQNKLHTYIIAYMKKWMK